MTTIGRRKQRTRIVFGLRRRQRVHSRSQLPIGPPHQAYLARDIAGVRDDAGPLKDKHGVRSD